MGVMNLTFQIKEKDSAWKWYVLKNHLSQQEMSDLKIYFYYS